MAAISGGKRLEDALRALAKKVNKPGTLRVGYLAKATYPDGTPVAMVGAIQEFGAPKANIPPRPAIRNMIADKSKGWPKAMAQVLVTVNYDTTAALDVIGQGIKSQWQDSILKLWHPPLSPKTVARKGFDKPLIEKGHMLNSVDYEIKS